MAIHSQDGQDILFQGPLQNGVVHGQVNESLVNHSAWRSRLVIGISETQLKQAWKGTLRTKSREMVITYQ